MVAAAPGATPPLPPRVWVLTGRRQGDRNQALALAELLGWPFEEKRLRFSARRHWPRLIASRGLGVLDAASRACVQPPWPDLVIAIGKHCVPVARAIRRDADRPVRLVQIGEPRCPPAWFDLVLTTPQYRVPPAANVVVLPLALSRGVRPADTPAAPPLHVLLVGGASWPWRLDEPALRAAAHMIRRHAEDRGGRAIALTSQRTPPGTRAGLRAVLGDAVDTVPYGRPSPRQTACSSRRTACRCSRMPSPPGARWG